MFSVLCAQRGMEIAIISKFSFFSKWDWSVFSNRQEVCKARKRHQRGMRVRVLRLLRCPAQHAGPAPLCSQAPPPRASRGAMQTTTCWQLGATCLRHAAPHAHAPAVDVLRNARDLAHRGVGEVQVDALRGQQHLGQARGQALGQDTGADTLDTGAGTQDTGAGHWGRHWGRRRGARRRAACVACTCTRARNRRLAGALHQQASCAALLALLPSFFLFFFHRL